MTSFDDDVILRVANAVIITPLQYIKTICLVRDMASECM